jgi:hypothetical protein
MTGVDGFNFLERLAKEKPELVEAYRDWTLTELWAFAKCEEGSSDSCGPDEDLMRRWLSRHKNEYPGDELAYRMFLRGDFSGWRTDDPDTPADLLSFDPEFGRMNP